MRLIASAAALLCLVGIAPAWAQGANGFNLKPDPPRPVYVTDKDGNAVPGGGGTANPYPGADYATAGKQDSTIAALGGPGDAEAQTGNGSLVALSKGQRAILSNLLASYGAVADAAAASGNGSMVALTKAIRDRLAGALTFAPGPGSMEQDVRASGTLNAATASAAITIPINGQSTVAFTFTGLTASGATLSYEQSNDGGTTWTGVQEVNTGTGATSLTRSADGQVRVAVQGRTNLRVRVSTPGTGTITVAWNVSVREGLISLASPAQMAGLDGTTPRVVLVTTTGALEPATAAAGKITRTSTALTANTSTTIAAANANRIALGLQCGSGGVSVDETGGALTAASVGNGTLFIPSGSGPYFTPPVATRTALTAYTATAQTCVVTEYLR